MSRDIRLLGNSRILLFAVLLPLLAVKVQAADFNCEKPKTAFERLACGELIITIQENEKGLLGDEQRQKLAELDDELNAVYKEAMTTHFDPVLLRREQRVWLKIRERCALDDNCEVSGLYRDRIDNLRYDLEHPPQSEADRKSARLLSMGSPPGDNFTFSREATSKGYGYGLCEALVRWINYTTPKGNISEESGRKAIRMPGLSYPAWQELDMQQHLELFAKIIEFKDHGTLSMPPSQSVQKQIEAARMGQIRLWMVKEDVHRLFEGKPETLITYSMSSTDTTSKNQGGEQRFFASPTVVTDDLRDVDIHATREMMGNGILLYYKGKPYFISAFGSHASTHSPLLGGCEITNFKPERSKK